MFNKGRDEREIAQVAQEIEPYRNIVVSYETDQRFQTMDVELITYGKHVITSNDRYQFSSAYLALARNRSLMTDNVADALTKPIAGQEDFKTDGFDYNSISTFLVNGYQAATDGLEAADRVSSVKGYKASSQETSALQSLLNDFKWPQPNQISSRFLAGSVNGLKAISVATHSQYATFNKSGYVPNNMKVRLRQRVDPLLATLEAKQKTIELMAKSHVETIKSEQALVDLYKDVMDAVAAADVLCVWLTVPKLLDSSFTLVKPLDESHPVESKQFDVGSLGGPAVKKAAAPAPATPAAPAGPHKSFDPGSLTAPAKKAAPPSTNVGKSFDPNSLSTPKPPEKHEFNPADLGKAAVAHTEQAIDPTKAQTNQAKTFSLDDLK
ncbi:MAG TPA: hypothetical protein VG992_03830 [Candidatus Saccharimonadales bacterium]|nr:hypothetical protein [Candidatus Saccharimonadales bacterium]